MMHKNGFGGSRDDSHRDRVGLTACWKVRDVGRVGIGSPQGRRFIACPDPKLPSADASHRTHASSTNIHALLVYMEN